MGEVVAHGWYGSWMTLRCDLAGIKNKVAFSARTLIHFSAPFEASYHHRIARQNPYWEWVV